MTVTGLLIKLNTVYRAVPPALACTFIKDIYLHTSPLVLAQ